MSTKKFGRQREILDWLKVNPTMRVNDLAEKLNVSTETIRRDLRELDEQGEVNRTYGGAFRSSNFEPALNERLALNLGEKRRIAKMAVDLLEENGVVLIGGGATCLHFARELRNYAKRLTVITPSLTIAFELGDQANIELVIPPGIYNGHEGLVLGYQTIEYINEIKVGLCFLGASGINKDGASEAMMAPSQLYKAMNKVASKTFILADHSKFGKRAMSIFASWQSGCVLVSDRSPELELSEQIRNYGGEIILP